VILGQGIDCSVLHTLPPTAVIVTIARQRVRSKHSSLLLYWRVLTQSKNFTMFIMFKFVSEEHRVIQADSFKMELSVTPPCSSQ